MANTASKELVTLHAYARNDFWEFLNRTKDKFLNEAQGLNCAVMLLFDAGHKMSH